VNILADNNSTATATQDDLREPQATQSAVTPETAPATTPVSNPIARSNGDLAPDLQPLGEGEPRKEVEGGRAYEITYIVIANNPEALDNAQNRLKTLIEDSGGALDNVRVSEVRRLAYPIAKRTEGIYVVANARFQKALTEDLDRFFKLEEAVLRHIILREDA
jgi:small subunit ribosomal protein S6